MRVTTALHAIRNQAMRSGTSVLVATIDGYPGEHGAHIERELAALPVDLRRHLASGSMVVFSDDDERIARIHLGAAASILRSHAAASDIGLQVALVVDGSLVDEFSEATVRSRLVA